MTIASKSKNGSSSVQFLRDKAVADKIGVSRPHLWTLVKTDPTFPRPVKLSANVTVWLESEINEWMLRKVAEVRNEKPDN